MKDLTQIWIELAAQGKGSDKGSIHSYLPVYEKILAPYRETANNVLEIGIFRGHSLLMWEEYFANAVVYGMDCEVRPHGGMANLTEMIKSDLHNIIIMDAENEKEIEKRFGGGKLDVIIEDANHSTEQQLNLYRIWKEYLAPGGIYIIEDVQDLDTDRKLFEDLGGEVIDLRNVKGRYDDCLIIFRK